MGQWRLPQILRARHLRKSARNRNSRKHGGLVERFHGEATPEDGSYAVEVLMRVDLFDIDSAKY
ncbi:hypothetical protein ColLi_13140 [Colletotrichum liriopes]|uniref:Uncharacterized protein n=1 Tax=Colletotrichum liriopes TaxID=708192 RepID=A0AA37H1Q0_9PEZI|nr:hypothetical protein ColLi_13140 [Colletotrichum liriopes]